MVADELKLLIRAETSKAVRDMKKAQRSMGQTHKSSQTLVKNLLRQGAAWAGAAVSVRAVIKAATASVEAFRKQEEATVALESAVERSQLLDGSAAESLKQFSQSLSDVTTISDQTIQSLAAQAVSTGKTEAETRKMIRAAVDMSSVMDMDVQQAFDNLLGSFTGTAGELEDFVPELANMSDEALKSGEAIDVVAREFDGAAESIAKTESGQLKQFRNALVDLSESIGEKVLQNVNGMLTGLTNVSSALADIIDRNNEIRDLRSGTAGETGDVSEKQYQDALEVTEDITERINEKRERLRKINQQITAYRQFDQEAQAELLTIDREHLRNQLRTLENEKEDAAWAYKAVDAYEEQQQEQRENEESSNETANNAEEIATATKKWGDNLKPVRTILTSVSEEADTVAKKMYGATLLDVGDTADPIREMFKERRRVQQEFYSDEMSRIEQQKQEYIDAGVERVDAEKWAEDQIRDYRIQQAEKWLGHIQGAFSTAMGLVQAYNQFQQNQLQRTMNKYDERMEQMEEQHEQEVSYAEKAGATEEELAEIKRRQEEEKEKLEEEKEKKRAEAEKKAFEREKAAQIAEATMAGAQAFVQALTAGPYAGPALASMIAGMTAAQIGIIAAQQYPGLASGGVVPAQGDSGGLYRLGDKNKAETVLPFDARKEGMGENITVNVSGVIGDRERVGQFINESIRRGRERGKIRSA